MSDEEKFKMYMEVPHEELVRMKIEEERLMEIMENERPQNYSTQPLFTLTADEVDNLQSLFKAIKIADKNELIHLGLVFDTFIDCLLTRIKQWQDEHRI